VKYSIVKADGQKWKVFGPRSFFVEPMRAAWVCLLRIGVRQMRGASIISIGILSS